MQYLIIRCCNIGGDTADKYAESFKDYFENEAA